MAPASRSSRHCTRSRAVGLSGRGSERPAAIAGQPPIPALHTDFPFAALGEELGLVGILAILRLYLVLVQRELQIASAAQDEFRAISLPACRW